MRVFRALTDTSSVINVFSGSPSSNATALLFGWSGGSMKHVSKYVGLWERNCKTILVVTTPISVLKMLSEVEVIERLKRDILSRLPDDDSDVFLHIFSNG